ncbi:AMP-binding protein [Verrucosispora sp. TAA-831]|uniref:AMP-binding protein n=1 Tax=Verrucosispora sp. TAA-831 TaxID=3422227 RepID=UPI003D6E4226
MLRTDLIRPLPELLRGHSAAAGDKVAFADDRRAVTYAQLEQRTARLAGHLAAAGVERGDRVAVLLANSVEVAESYLAVNRAAAVAVPLNPAATDSELTYLLEDCGAVAVITDRRHRAQVERTAGRRPPMLIVTGAGPRAGGPALGYERLAGAESPRAARDDLDLDAAAWMLYTSGTTGRPKGVVSSQRMCLWSVAACYAPILGLSPDDHLLWPLPMFHSIAHVLCVQGAVAVGASVRIMAGFSADEVLERLRQEPVTFLPGVPTMFHYLLRALGGERLTAHRLRHCLVTGSVASAALRSAFESAVGVPLLDTYGATETSGAITANWPTGARVAGSCGLPVPGLAVRVVHRDSGADLPPRQEGEVWVRGPNVMLGYHNQPGATAQVLRHGWYRTGDLAYLDEAGYLTITGRSRELIIRGGEGIHPAEIEEVIRAVPGVADVVVAGRPHEILGEVPVAGLVPAGHGSIHPEAVFRACRERLSAFKIPQELHEITDVPRTSSGKPRRHLLNDRQTQILAVRLGGHDPLYRLEWSSAPVSPARASAVDRPSVTVSPGVVSAAGWVAVGLDPATVAAAGIGATTDDLRAVVHGHETPAVVVTSADQDWAAVPTGADRAAAAVPTRLVVVTHGAVSTGAGEGVPDPTGAAVWARVRSLPADQRDRVTIVDLDDNPVSARMLTLAVALGEPGVAIRAGAVLVPRPAPARTAAEVILPVLHRSGAALITGRSADLMIFAAHRLVRAHGIRHVSFVTTTAMADLDDATVSTHPSVAEALAAIPVDRQLTVVVHTDVHATDELASLHRQTEDIDLAGFVVFSAAAGVLGDPTHPELAAAAAHADAFAQNRQARGLPTVAIGWGSRGISGAEAAAVFDVARGLGGVVTVAEASPKTPRSDRPVDRPGHADQSSSPEPPATAGPATTVAVGPATTTGAPAIARPKAIGLGCRSAGDADGPAALRRLPAEAGRPDDPIAIVGLSFRSAVTTDLFDGDVADPRLRLLLERSWHALESARIDPSSVRGTGTAVFAAADLAGPLTQGSGLVGPLARTLGLVGSALTVAVGSSTLVALHLARRAVEAGECDLALVAAPDGVLVLERHSRARRHGHAALAMIRGSAVVHPNRRPDRSALNDAGLVDHAGLAEDAAPADGDAPAGVADLHTAVLAVRRGTPRGFPHRREVSSGSATIVLEQVAADVCRAPAAPTRPLPLVLSARTPAALRARAGQLLAIDLPVADLATSLATTRAVLAHRAVVVAQDAAAARAGLTALAAARSAPNLITGPARPTEPGLFTDATGRPAMAFLFAGRGARPELGADLHRAHPVFAAALDSACAELDRHLDRPVRELMFAAPGTPAAYLLDRAGYAEPALFAFEVALFRLADSWGLRPDFLLGHSVGEIVAAHVAGSLSLPDAARLVAARARLVRGSGGAAAVVHASATEVAASLKHRGPTLAVAAVDGPEATVVAGEEQAVEEVTALWQVRGRRTRRLPPGHVPGPDSAAADLRAVAAEISFREPAIPVVSTVTGRRIDLAELRTADHWVRHLRQTVRFADGLAWLRDHGVGAFVELGPDDALTTPLDGAIRVALQDGQSTETFALAAACGRLHVAGVPLDWAGLLAGTGGSPVDLPLYPGVPLDSG